MMEAAHSLPELVEKAKADAKTYAARISEISAQGRGQDATAAQHQELGAATHALERVAIDIFSVFEARMQHHFKRGPFSRKLKALLIESDKADLADDLHQYYLAINVLKHGKGASYRELLELPHPKVALKAPQASADFDAAAPSDLVDITVPGFFDDLAKTILEAVRFLENS